MARADTDNDDLRERVARAMAEADGITICSDASYRHSSYGIRADAALSATPIEPLQQRVERLEGALRDLLAASERHIFSTECQAERDAARAALGDDAG